MTNTPQEIEKKFDEYRQLPQAEQILVDLLAVAYMPCNRNSILRGLDALTLPDITLPRFTSATVKTVLDSLWARRFLVKYEKGNNLEYQCHPLVREPFFRRLFLEKKLLPFVAAVKKEMTLHTQQEYDRWTIFRSFAEGIQHLRIAFFTGESLSPVYSLLDILYKKFPSDFRTDDPLDLLFVLPFPAGLLEALPFGHARFIVYTLAERRLDDLADLAPILSMLDGLLISSTPDQAAEYVHLYCLLALFFGRIAAAETALARPQSAQEAEQLWGYAAWAAFLHGRTGEAVPLFEKNLAIIKKISGKKKTFPQSYIGIFHLLALIKSGDQPSRLKALGYVDFILGKSGGHGLVHFAESLRPVLLALLDRPEEAKAPVIGTTQNVAAFYQFFSMLCRYWFQGDLPKENIVQLKALRKLAGENGYTWLQAEAALLLARLDEDRKANERLGLDFHQKNGSVTLVDLIKRQPPWERALLAMIGMADNQATEEDKGGKATQRLTWLVGYDTKYHYLTFIPRLQTRGKSGKWSQGRNVALKSFKADAAKMDFLTGQDQRAIATIKEVYESSSWGYHSRKLVQTFDSPKTILALVGHPCLFQVKKPDAKLEIVTGSPELMIRRKGKAITISLSHKPIDNFPGMTIIEEQPWRLRVILFTEDHLRLAKLAATCEKLPTEAEPLLRQAVAAVAPFITIQSDIGGDELDLETIESISTPLVRLYPHGNGIKGEMVVRPFGGDGPVYQPGAGAKNLIAEIAGKRVKANRDLARETNLAQELLDQCPQVAAAEEMGEWVIDDLEACLELLRDLQAVKDQVTIEWPEGERFRLRGNAGFGQFSLKVKEAKEWFEASGGVTIDQELTLDLKTLLVMAAKRRGNFIPIDDTTFVAIEKDLVRAIEDLRDLGDETKNGVRFRPIAAMAVLDLAGEADSCHGDKAWKRLATRLGETVDPDQPSTLQAELREYQLTGFKWLAQLAHWGMGACLADDMGLGKTVQALAALLLRAPDGPALVVAPLSVLMNWQDEAARFAPTLRVLLLGPSDRQAMVAGLGPFDLVLASYGLLLSEADLLSGVSWQTVVLDEAQAIKNVEAKRSMAAMRLSAGFRIITTGTPVENHLGELWTLFHFLNPGLLGTYQQFQDRFAIPIEKDGSKKARERLKRLVRPFILRRLKSQVLTELPARTDIVIQVEPSQKEGALYEAQRQLAVEKLTAANGGNPGQRALRILAEITKLRRLCCNPRLVLPDAGIESAKMSAFAELLEELLEGRHKVLVFSQFVDHLTLIVAHLRAKKISYQYLDGQTPVKEREKSVRAFQSGVGDVFCISLKAGGAGLNLTAADYVIHMDPWWNPAVEDQASDRAHRIGQLRPVTVYRLIMKNTIEEQIIKLHHKKRDLADSLLDGSDIAGRISPDELLALLKERTG